MEDFVHVVAGEGGAATVGAALRLLGREESVIALRDPLNVGPLSDLDTDRSLRLTFWTQVCVGDVPAQIRSDDLREQASWAVIRSAAVVTTWYGPHPMEYLVACRVAAICRDECEVREVVRPPHSRPALAAFYNAINLASPEDLTGLAEAALRPTELHARRATWRRLVSSRNVMFRELREAQVIELAADGYDERIMSLCAEWTPTVDVVAQVLVDTPISDLVLAWRIRELVRGSQIEARGDGPYASAEIRHM